MKTRLGAYQLVRLLIELGHRHIAILSGPLGVSTAEDRLAGYRRAMREAGFDDDAQTHLSMVHSIRPAAMR